MERIDKLKSVKLQLLNNYNKLLLQQITDIEEDIEAFETLVRKSDAIIANIIKIDNEIKSSGIEFKEFNKDFKTLLLEIDKNNRDLTSKVKVAQDIIMDKRAKLKVGRKSVNKYNAYNKKTSYGFNMLK